jgi:hypothetical protein
VSTVHRHSGNHCSLVLSGSLSASHTSSVGTAKSHKDMRGFLGMRRSSQSALSSMQTPGLHGSMMPCHVPSNWQRKGRNSTMAIIDRIINYMIWLVSGRRYAMPSSGALSSARAKNSPLRVGV